MQSLGKVPSARRPPANLPSLKAETSSPAPLTSSDQPQQQQQQTNSSTSASWISDTPSQVQPITNATVISAREAQQGAASWSSVATGNNVKEENSSQPPLYQSPQFQNEFPSLDGSMTSGTGANVISPQPNVNSHDTGEAQMNLRPSIDAASWMQQQQQNSTSGRGAGENGNYPPPDLAVPPKFMALLPPFLRGSAMGSSGQNHQQNLPSPSGNYQNQGRQNSGRGNYGGSNYNDYTNGPSRRQGPPPRYDRGRHGMNNGNNEERSSSYEPELVVQRPIIKEEELERIDSLARDDGWSKHDEIDYNKKLQFSDDEAEDVKPKDGKMMLETFETDLKINGFWKAVPVK
jgi:hypothetical protein